MRIETTIYVEPVGKARPRTITRGGKTWSYTPRGTAHTETLIRESVLRLGQFFEAGTPLRLEATFYRVRPKSLPKKVRFPATRPDWDNYGKLLTDALQKFIYPNDSQIVDAVIAKRFGSPPRIELKIEEVNDG
jgi:Holliday junction resolvase RusA-like endonuclease